MKKNNYTADKLLKDHFDLKKMMKKYSKKITEISTLVSKTVKSGGCVFWCGNGGSAADAQHLAAELIGRFEKERKAIKSIALNSDTSILTALANDYSYDIVFSRQLEGLGSPNDILLTFSTSGNSKNILNILKKSKIMKIKTIAILGNNGGKAKKLSDYNISLPLKNTARIQEMHILIGHIICSVVENNFVKNEN